ncbi:MAG: adenylate/guanylate cyclase domain-containing protein [Neomegalonema sp.]|nr:adenylate/guanylate cyclase domain-containing protein [Neomegalonema sp.]
MIDKPLPSSFAERLSGMLRRAVSALRAANAHGQVAAVVILAALSYVRFVDPTPLTAMRLQSFDMFQRAEPRSAIGDEVVIVDIDEASIRQLGQWPWSRDRLGQLVERLDQAGAAVIGFDMVFAEPDRLSPDQFALSSDGLPPMMRGLLSGLENTDEAFARSIAKASVVLGMSGDPGSYGSGIAVQANPVSAPTPVLSFGPDPRPTLFGYRMLLTNIDTLEAKAAGKALFNTAPEHDGVVRRVPAVMHANGTLYPSLSVEMLRVASGAEHVSVYTAPGSGDIEQVRIRDTIVPTDPNGRMWVKFAPSDPSIYRSAADILQGKVDPATFKDKFVLVGTSAIGLRDLRLSPLGQIIPGVEVHAQIINAFRSGDHLLRPWYAVGLEHLMTLVAGIVMLISFPKLQATRSLPIFAATIFAVWAVAFFSYRELSVLLDPTYPAMAVALIYGVLAYSAYTRTESQRRQIRTAFGQYLSPALVKQLADNPQSLQLGGESREMTFLFCDIAGFTAFVETAEPEDLVALLNEYLDGVCDIIIRHGGTIDKIVGDAVHAMFNAPLDDPEHARNAVCAAREIEVFVADFQKRKRAEGFDFGSTRIGVNTGKVIVGNFGGSRRFDYTAHGDAINTAARLESANKHLGTTICVSETTQQLCADLPFRPIGTLYLKGKDKGVATFAPLAPGESESAAARAYAGAYAQLRLDPTSTRLKALFSELAAQFPADPLIALHHRRLAEGAQGDVIRMTSK